MALLSRQPPPTDKPFAEALRELLGDEISLRRLSAESRQSGPGISAPYLSRLLKGIDAPTLDVIDTVSGALGIAPAHFLEYRLACARAMLDEYGPGGPEAAAANLRRFERVFGRRHAAPVRRRRKLAA